MSTSPVQNHDPINLRLPLDGFRHIFSFLQPIDLMRSERVCRDWNKAIWLTDQWKMQCQIQLGLSPETNPALPNILDGRVYELYIGKVGPEPRIPKGISLKNWNKPDPCDPATTIGRAYVWIYIPPYFEIDQSGCSLDRADDPNDPQAPRLIRSEEESEHLPLRVPPSLNNIIELFKCPKTGNPSLCSYIWPPIIEQHGNERMAAGWICMRRDVIGRGLPFKHQQALARISGVVLSELLPRILFNFIEHTRSQVVNFYPDGRNPQTHERISVRTSTFTRDRENNNWPSGCGAGGLNGINISQFGIEGGDRLSHIGVAVTFPRF